MSIQSTEIASLNKWHASTLVNNYQKDKELCAALKKIGERLDVKELPPTVATVKRVYDSINSATSEAFYCLNSTIPMRVYTEAEFVKESQPPELTKLSVYVSKLAVVIEGLHDKRPAYGAVDSRGFGPEVNPLFFQ
jgi:hypothetical protein